MRLDIGYGTHRGRVRTANQDTVGVFAPPRRFFQRQGQPVLFMVADGMGGHQSGEVASRMAVETMRRSFFREFETAPLAEALKATIIGANEAVKAQAAKSSGMAGMGTTVVAAAVAEKIVCFANVGDSRGYIVRKGEVRQVTDDHSLVAEQLRMGLITPEESAESHRNVITRAVGRREDLEVDIFEEPWEVGDAFILCSDGLWGQVSELQMAMVVSEMAAQPAARKLIELAMTSQAPDNISVIVVRRVE